MPPETDPSRCLAKAADDLRSAEANLQSGFLLPSQSLCDSQQSAEKSIKAVLLALGIRFPFFHDLEALFKSGIPGASKSGKLSRLGTIHVFRPMIPGFLIFQFKSNSNPV